MAGRALLVRVRLADAAGMTGSDHTPAEITADDDGHLSISFQNAVSAIGRIVAPGETERLEGLADTSPNEARRVLDEVLLHHPPSGEQAEAVLRVARAYGERRFIRSMERHAPPDVRERTERWARDRIRRRIARRGVEREAGAPFDSRARSLGGDVPDAEVRIVHAAIRLFDGTVLGAPDDGTHPDVVESLGPSARARMHAEVESEGFVDAHGNYLDRGEASLVTGVAGESSEVAGTVQGGPLRRVQEETLTRPPLDADGVSLDDEDEADALDFLEQFRVDRSL